MKFYLLLILEVRGTSVVVLNVITRDVIVVAYPEKCNLVSVSAFVYLVLFCLLVL